MALGHRRLGVVVDVVDVGVMLAVTQQAALLQKALDAWHGALEHGPDLPCGEMG